MASGPGKQSRQRPPVVDRGRVGLATRMRNYFFAGVLVAAPISITTWITWNLLQFIDNKVTPLVPPVWNPETYLPFSIPGVGLILAIAVLTLAGFMAAGIVGRSVMRFGERMLARVPVVRGLYSATKQIFETVLAQKSKAFRQVALVEYPMRGTWAVGFITGRTVGEVQSLTDETVFNVFVPATPNPTTGFLLFLPERDVHILDMTVEEGIKLVVSGGIVTPDGKRVAPSPGTDPGPRPRPARDEKARNRQPGALRRLRNYFLAGILVTAPVGITFWLVWKLISFVDQSVVPLIPRRWNPETYLPFDIPGLGLIVAAVAFTLIGMLTAGFVGKLFMARRRTDPRPGTLRAQPLWRHQADHHRRPGAEIQCLSRGRTDPLSAARVLGHRLHHRRDRRPYPGNPQGSGHQCVPPDDAEPDLRLPAVRAHRGVEAPHHDRGAGSQDGRLRRHRHAGRRRPGGRRRQRSARPGA